MSVNKGRSPRGKVVLKTKGSKKLVIVESPVKAKTISRFLGSDYIVESCMGHIRDLPGSAKELPEKFRKKPWAAFGVDVENDFYPFYRVPEDKKAIVKKLKGLVGEVKELILATDEDREGESISWHLQKILTPKVPVKRMVFHEITKSAIETALKNFRKVDDRLVQAQEARRILDRLVGYSLSPVLWKKVARGLSAGRVQSVAMALVSDRELERLSFKKSVYWDVSAEYKKTGSNKFMGRLLSYKGKRMVRSSDFNSHTGALEKKDVLIMDEKTATKLRNGLKGKIFQVTEVEKKQVVRRPPPPFITSTLQQEGNRKLGFSSKQTMGLAQKLYEQGLITYMRTDSVFLSQQALKSARGSVLKFYGKENLPPKPRFYKQKSKGAQEAHEAIRPAGENFIPPERTRLSGPLLKLYELIWKRTLASQMKDCIQNQVKIKMQTGDLVFQSSGMTIAFSGFYSIYKDQKSEETAPLPPLKKGDKVPCVKAEALRHETKPPARYTEASLVQKLEKEGVGRPSTYASIMTALQERGYVKKEKNALIPTFTALAVNRFLQKNFPDYVDMGFTSEMEKDLDDIASGKKNHIKYLKAFYTGNKGLKKLIVDQEKKIKDQDFRSMSLKGFEDYSFHVGPFGAYVSKKKGEVSASLPVDVYPGEVTLPLIEQILENKAKGGRSLGRHPKTGQEILVVLGRYGPYIKMDLPSSDAEDKKGIKDKKPTKKSRKKQWSNTKTVSLSPFFTEDNLTLEGALKLLELPKIVGIHPSTKKEIKKAVGRYGPYIVHAGEFRSVPKDIFFDIDLKYAVKSLNEPKKRSSSSLKEWKHPKTKKPIYLMKGRFGPYVKYNKKNYSLPSALSPESLDEKAVLQFMEESAKTSKGSKKFSSKKFASKKFASKKFASKKFASKGGALKVKDKKSPVTGASSKVKKKGGGKSTQVKTKVKVKKR